MKRYVYYCVPVLIVILFVGLFVGFRVVNRKMRDVEKQAEKQEENQKINVGDLSKNQLYDIISRGNINGEDREAVYFRLADMYVEEKKDYAAYNLLMSDSDISSKYANEISQKYGKYNSVVYADDGKKAFYGFYPQNLIEDDALLGFIENAEFEDDTAMVMGIKVARISDGNIYSYYEYAPISYNVAAGIEGRTALVSEKILDEKIFSESVTGVSFEVSDLRKWLNGDLFEIAFKGCDTTPIASIRSKITWNHLYGANIGSESVDRISILEAADVKNGNYGMYDETVDVTESIARRRCRATDYAKAKGVYCDEDGFGRYWTRTPSSPSLTMYMIVMPNGEIVDYGYCTNVTGIGVRFFLELS